MASQPIKTRLVNVASVWRQARPWLLFPQPFLIKCEGYRPAAVLANPAWLALKAYGWTHGFNASVRYRELERGMWIRLNWFYGEGWRVV